MSRPISAAQLREIGSALDLMPLLPELIALAEERDTLLASAEEGQEILRDWEMSDEALQGENLGLVSELAALRKEGDTLRAQLLFMGGAAEKLTRALDALAQGEGAGS